VKPTKSLLAVVLSLVSTVVADARAEAISQPPNVAILLRTPGTARGLIFVAPKTAPSETRPLGPQIVDNQGRPVWFYPVTNGQMATDFRVQRYHGQPVLTWSQEKGFGGLAQDESVDLILDSHYNPVATVRAGNGLDADGHEFLLTPEDTALITIFNLVPADLSSVNGPSSGTVIEGVVQEIDIATGEVLFEWHSLDHVGFDESYEPVPSSANTPWDYFHLNAVSLAEDGNLLISSRYASAVYKVDRHSGQIVWRLGGKKTNFALGSNARFWYQHNPIADGSTIRIFDNEATEKTVVGPCSRVIWLEANPAIETAILFRSVRHPNCLSVTSEGFARISKWRHICWVGHNGAVLRVRHARTTGLRRIPSVWLRYVSGISLRLARPS
jgi:hypothetical protein